MHLGPVEYVLIGFPEHRFTGEIAAALADLVDNGTVRILDLVFVTKDADGDVLVLEFDQLDEALGFDAVEGDADGVMSDEDVALAAAALEPGASALMIIWEDRWAAPFADAVRRAGGEIVDGARIPHELVTACSTASRPRADRTTGRQEDTHATSRDRTGRTA